MTVIRLTKEFSFEAAHALDGYDGPCREIHGHSYRLFVTVKGTPLTTDSDPKAGMVMDFGALKRIIHEEIIARYDHALVLQRSAGTDDLRAMLAQQFDNLVEVDYGLRARTCSPTSPTASAPVCRKGSRCTPCGYTKPPPPMPNGMRRIIFVSATECRRASDGHLRFLSS